MNEFEFIRRIAGIEQHKCPFVEYGIGDDCAVFDAGGTKFLITTDTLVEEVHFDVDDDPALIGRKILAVSISDVAAMGGKPLFAVVTSSMSPDRFNEKSEKILRGIFNYAKKSEIQIIGGDTTGFKPGTDGMVFTLTLIGKMDDGVAPVMRNSAKIGDLIAVTGNLGGSLISKRHLNFTPRVPEGTFLAKFGVSSMLDVSDGLSGDLGHILEQSIVGAKIYEEKIPVSDAAIAHSRKTEQPVWVHALNDGEDFELLLTFPASKRDDLVDSWDFATELSIIGEIVEQSEGYKIQLANGQRIDVRAGSFDHFNRNT